MKRYFMLALKGAGMGVANVIPGVSGGTIALIAGIYQELIDSIKSFNLEAIRLLFRGRFKELAGHLHLYFLISIFAGAAAGIFTLAGILDYLFINYPVYIWAFFFGLIAGSVYSVARKITRWSSGTVLMFAIGTVVAVTVSLLTPASENDAIWYLFICGVVAICSMILPGLSGSFVLILMGNYKLVAIDAINDFNLRILVPLGIGAVVGLMSFSRFLSWIFKRFGDQTLGLLTGFMLGSLAMLWPWKRSFDAEGNVININRFGAFVDEHGALISDVKVFGYRQIMPESFDIVVLSAAAVMLLGVAIIYILEKRAAD